MKIKTNVRAGKQSRGATDAVDTSATSSSSTSSTPTPVAPYVPTTYIRCGVTITY